MERSRVYHRLVNEIQGISKDEDTSTQSALRDVLTDLRHVAKDYGLDFNEALTGSEEVYREEEGLYHG